jgi:hypothetical protein
VEKRPYRSIVSIPLQAKGNEGKPIAVVSIDADEANFFDADGVLAKVRPLVSPALNTIGFVLSFKGGEGYEFPA